MQRYARCARHVIVASACGTKPAWGAWHKFIARAAGEDAQALQRTGHVWPFQTVEAMLSLDEHFDQVRNHESIQVCARGSGTCTTAIHAVLWGNGTAFPLPNLGHARSNIAYGINDQGQIVGRVRSPDGTAFSAALWQNGAITNLGTLPGDFAALATGINNQGQVVGSTLDSGFNWSHGFIWQDGVMTDLNTLFPASSNLFVTMANKINERGQISGMATVPSEPDAGNIHAFLATPVNASIGTSVADVARTHPKSNSPANVGNQLLQRFGLGRSER